MGKTKRREGSEVEYLRGEVRKLEKENRQLKRRVRQLDRQAHFYDELVESIAEEIEIPQATDKCEKCKEGTQKLLDLKHVKYIVCDKCDHRKKV